MKTLLTSLLSLAFAASLHAQDPALRGTPASPVTIVTTPAGQPIPVPRAVPVQLGTNAPVPAPAPAFQALPGPPRPVSPVSPVSPAAKAAAVPVPVSSVTTQAVPAPAPAPATAVVAPANTPAISPAPALQAPGAATPAQAPKSGPRVPPRTDKTIPPGALKLPGTPIDQVLELYAEYVGRTILRSPSVIGTPLITLKTQTELTVEEAVQAIESVLALHGIVTIPVGEKFVLVVLEANSLREGAAFNTATNAADLPEAGQYVTKIIQLKEVKPSEIVNAIQPFAKIAGGILPIDTTQVLVIRDYAINVKRMMEIIEKIDQAIPLEEDLRVFPIRYALAAEVASVLGTLTLGGTSGGAGATGATTTRGGIRRPSTGQGVTGGFQGFNPGQPGQAQQPFGQVQPVGGIPQQANPAAAAAGFQNRLQQIVNQASRTAGGGALLGNAKIITYERNNSILAIGTKQELAMVEKLIQELDKVQKQVLIEAIILEVTLDDSKKLGVSTAQSQKKFGDNFTGRGGIRTETPFSSGLTNQVTSQGLPLGLSYFANLGKAWEVAIEAIATDSTVNVLSRPRIQTSHAETATLFIGDTIPFINATYANLGGTPTSSYQQREVGIQLQVLPLINEDGLVVMDIAQNIEQLGTKPVTIDGNQVPTTSKRQATAKVAVKDGDTIILGGYITTQKGRTKAGVPGLKDIPYLGALFRSTSDSTKRTELIVLIRPTVLPTPEMASVTAQKEREKMFGVARAEKEILDDEKQRAERNKAEVEKLERAQRDRDARQNPGRK